MAIQSIRTWRASQNARRLPKGMRAGAERRAFRVTEWGRRTGFFILDKVRNESAVSAALRDLERVSGQSVDAPGLRKYQQDVLKNLLVHAQKSTKFYAAMSSLRLQDYPVINKAIIRASVADFRATGGLECRPFREMETSGSTGTPFSVVQDKRKTRRVQAELIYFYRQVGWDVGRRLVNFVPGSASYTRKRYARLLTNEDRVSVDTAELRDGERMFEAMTVQQGATLLTLPSILEALELYIAQHDDPRKHHVRSIVSSGSVLSDRTRRVLRSYFGCPVVSRYSDQECGVLAQDTHEDNVFEINGANYIIEVLDLNTDETAADGVLGRVVVTDLYNFAQPMIRYDTGDLAAIETRSINGIRKRVLVDLTGRRYDAIFDIHGQPILTNALVNYLVELVPDALQIQFAQVGRSDFRLKVNGAVDAATEAAALDVVKDFLGDDATLVVEEVNELPVLSSGKRQPIVNLWNKSEQTENAS